MGKGINNMTIEVALLLSIASFSFAVYQGIANMKRNQKTDDKSEATQLTTVIVKLENIEGGISDIKKDINSVKNDVREDRERIVKLEAKMDICLPHCSGLKGDL